MAEEPHNDREDDAKCPLCGDSDALVKPSIAQFDAPLSLTWGVILPGICIGIFFVLGVLSLGFIAYLPFGSLMITLVLYLWIMYKSRRQDLQVFADHLWYCAKCNHVFLVPVDPDAGAKRCLKRVKRFLIDLYYRDSRRKPKNR